MALEKELATYNREKDWLLARDEDRHALIKDDKVVATWDTYRDALLAGHKLFGLDPFLIKRIEALEFPLY
jgi:hypothetical protein